MKTRKNNRKKRSKGGATNIAINTINTVKNVTTIPSPTSTINPKKRMSQHLSNTATSTKQILNITTKNVNQSGKKFNTDISVYTVALHEIDWIMESLPYFGADADKKTIENIRKDIVVLQEVSYTPINNTKKDNIKPIIDHIGYLLEKLKNLNTKMQLIIDNKIGSNLSVLNRNTLFKKIGEHIARMFGFSKKYTELFSTMRDRLQLFRNK